MICLIKSERIFPIRLECDHIEVSQLTYLAGGDGESGLVFM